MLLRGKVEEALERKRALFVEGAERSQAVLERYAAALEELMDLPGTDVLDRVGGVEWPGALPTSEWGNGSGSTSGHPRFIVPFQPEWSDHEDAMAWALSTFGGATTVAIDGSQVAPSKEFGVPVSLVQVAWYQNPHDADYPYIKDVRNEIVTPGDTPDEMEEYAFAESRLNQCRFAMEMEVATERIGALGVDSRTPAGGPLPLVFTDGSLVLSFTSRMPPISRDAYLLPLFAMLDRAETRRVPVIGYVDTSLASDLATLVRTAFDLVDPPPSDGLLLQSVLGIFDRTVACRCARGDVLPHYRRPERDRSGDILFIYLLVGPTKPPVRIEFPSWILEAGLLDRVVDLVRAEIVVGNGYPYALETADAAAVLTREDRMAFYRLFHQFAEVNRLDRALPGKSVSKAHRR